MSEVVLVEKEGPLALITLNRPEKLNALDYALIDRLMEVLDAIEDDDDTRVLVLTGAGEPITASEACALGLVNDVVPHERLLDAAFALAHKIAAKSPLAVAACLASVTRGINVPIDEGLAIEANYFARMVPTRDIEEGLSAWLERRKPQFTGC
jgi:enoyl-CoA hydratase/carnithine racemase